MNSLFLLVFFAKKFSCDQRKWGLLYRYYKFYVDIVLVYVHLNWLNCFYFLICVGDPLVILIGCIILLSPFLDVLMMSMSAVSCLTQLDCGIFCLQNAFPWLIIEMVLKETMPRFSYFADCFSWKLMLPYLKSLRQNIHFFAQ